MSISKTLTPISSSLLPGNKPGFDGLDQGLDFLNRVNMATGWRHELDREVVLDPLSSSWFPDAGCSRILQEPDPDLSVKTADDMVDDALDELADLQHDRTI